MQRTELKTQLVAKGAVIEGLIYNNAGVAWVYIGQYQNQPAAIKVIVAPSESDYATIEREYQAFIHITHSSVLRMIDCFWAQDSGQWLLVLATELCRQDLAKLIKERAKAGQYWSEAEAWALLKTLVSAFDYMQQQGYAHRDIKAENIFLTTEGQVKVGDFGSSRFMAISHMQATLAGSPLYLSPLLKAAYLSRQTSATHNVYKSDVYSLGVTMLYVLSLNPPMSLMDTRDLDQTVRTLLEPLYWYSPVIKQIVMWMTTADEGRRCDFAELQAHIQTLERSIEPPPQAEQPAVAQPDSAAIQPGSLPPGQSDATASLVARARMTVMCLGCKQELQRSELQGAVTVQLYCDPSDHVYCNLDCFRKFLHENEGNEACPICREPINPELLQLKNEGWGEWLRKKVQRYRG